MDFSSRSSHAPQPASTGPQYSGGASTSSNNKKAPKLNKQTKFIRWGAGILGLLVVALVAALIVAIGFGGTKSESTYVDNSKMQAVFLQTGQVYFGNVKSLNSKYFVLTNVYYLQTASSTTDTKASTDTNVSLVKLGCELHAPYDQMLINRDQVTFWENLQTDGQVAKAVATFQKNNPNGQKCSDQAAPSTTNVQSTSGTGTTKQ